MINITQIKQIHLLTEFRTSIELMKLGFGEIQNINSNNDFYHLPFQLTSSGIERFLKCYICLGYFEKFEKFPDSKTLKNFAGRNGHDILLLKKEVLANYFTLRSKDDLLLKEDKYFLEKNSELNDLLYILSEFGKYSRYHNLDIVTGRSNASINVETLWDEFLNEILRKNPSLFSKFFSKDFIDVNESHSFLNFQIISILERFIRALSRQFTFANLGSMAKSFSGDIFEFLRIKDEELGKKNYKKIVKEKIQTSKNPYLRTEIDNFNRDSNSEIVYKKLMKKDFGNDWPFLSEEVIIECRQKYWSIITIEGYDYALNGSASDKFKLESVEDSGMMVPGSSTSKYREMAENLWNTK